MAAPDDPIHQAHDKLFRAGFGDPATAAGFLRAELPPAVAARIDWNRLRLEPASFVDSAFRRSESDLLFSAPAGENECLVYLLFEHQTREEPLLALRLLRYMVRIWEAWLKPRPKALRLPVITPVVLAQNAQKWKLSPRFASLIELPVEGSEEFAAFIPDFTFRLIELAGMSFDAIRGTPAGIMILRTMKAERLALLLDLPVWDEALLVQVPQEIRDLLIRYILGSDVDFPAFERRVKLLHQADLRSTTMTLAEQILQKGRQEGRQEGLQEILINLREWVLEVLLLRLGEVPAEIKVAIDTMEDEAHLKALHRAAIQAASMDEFARSL